MSLVGWLIVLSLPVYAAVQIVLLVALGRRLALQSGDVALTRPPAGTFADGSDEPLERGSRRACPTCGSSNDLTYTFCRECLSRLPAAVAVESAAV